MLKRKFNDELRASLIGRPTIYGDKGIGGPFVPISPEDRDKILQRLAVDDRNMVCENCGSTKPAVYFESIGAVSCCPERRMVQSVDLLAELDRLRAIAPEQVCQQAAGVQFGQELQAYAHRIGGEAVSARVGPNSGGKDMRLFINLTKKSATHIKASRVNARYGIGDDADKVLLTFGDKGAFQFCRDQKSRKFCVALPPPLRLPKGVKLATEACDYGWREVGRELVVTLPLSAWLGT